MGIAAVGHDSPRISRQRMGGGGAAPVAAATAGASCELSPPAAA